MENTEPEIITRYHVTHVGKYKIVVTVDGNGVFRTVIDNVEIVAKTLDDLKGAVQEQLRIPVNCAFVEYTEIQREIDGQPELVFNSGKILHYGSGLGFIVQFDHEHTESRPGWEQMLRGDTDTKELERLWKAYREAVGAFRKFKEAHRLRLGYNPSLWF